jgi:hypothetical protein
MALDYSVVVTGLKCGSPNCNFLALNVRDLNEHSTWRHKAQVRGTSCTIRKTVDETGSTQLAEVVDGKPIFTQIAMMDIY